MASGFSQADAQGDFSRARRARLLADIGRRLRREPDDVALILPFEEVVEALGVVGREDHGLQVVPLEAIVGTVDRAADFDRGFRPTSPRLRSRWERIAAAQRRGESLPPISLYRVGDLFFVRDGHHRVSVAKSLGRDDIDAYVVEVQTRVRLGRVEERYVGLQTIDLDSILGTVDRGAHGGFDRQFRPTTARVRARWERIANAARRGESLPPISVYRIGDVHFVRDGHHRVSVARALGARDIEADVVELGAAGQRAA